LEEAWTRTARPRVAVVVVVVAFFAVRVVTASLAVAIAARELRDIIVFGRRRA
jgi:hypothetical protein